MTKLLPGQRMVAGERLARAMCPREWAAHDTGTTTNEDGWIILDSLKFAQNILAAYPGVIPVINAVDQEG